MRDTSRSRTKAPESMRDLPLGLKGHYYEDRVPDTLDLAERAKLGLNYLTELIDEELDYEMYFTSWFDQYSQPALQTHVTSLGACQAKALEARALLRVMSGSRLNLEREAKMVAMMAGMLGADGLYWVPGGRPDKPWLQIPEPFAMVHGQGRMARAMFAWYQYTGDSVWKNRIDKMVSGLDRIAVHKEDYAYFPTHGFYGEEYLRSCYTQRGWKDTTEPQNEKGGEEGSLFNHQGHMPGVLANWYRLTGNEHALRLSGQLVRFLMKPDFWADWGAGEYPFVVGEEHSHWHGHYHGHINTLRAILEYAVAANDARLKAFVRDGYEWTRQLLVARLGYFDQQGCGTARMIGLAAKLSDAGVGDYWEDVDQYIRNHGVEQQITDEDITFLQGLAAGEPPPDERGVSTENVIRRCIGGFGGLNGKNRAGLCCAAERTGTWAFSMPGTASCPARTARLG